MRQWANNAIKTIEADYHRSADTHLIRLDLPRLECVQFYLKDESTHPTGSLKHRLARSLFLFGLCNGLIQRDTPIIESRRAARPCRRRTSHGCWACPSLPSCRAAPRRRRSTRSRSTAARATSSPRRTSTPKRTGSRAERNGHYMDQFTNAERATDWRGNNNIAESIFTQMQCEEHPMPAWVVMSAGTGGTSATIGRYIRYRCYDTKLCVADPEHSVFHAYYESGDRSITLPSWLERRRHRPSARGAFVRAWRDRPDDDRSGRRVVRGPARAGRHPQSQVRRLHRNEHVCGLPDRGRIERAGPALQRRLHDLRLGRALSRHLLQRPLAEGKGFRHRALPATAGRVSRDRTLAADE